MNTSTPILPPETHISHIHLRVRSIQMARTFYVGLLGMTLLEGSDNDTLLQLGTDPNASPLLTITAEKTARTRPFHTTGLYHIAFLFPDRNALACTLMRLLQHGWPLQGAADHGVSEAIYLADAEGNGIELYVDRPKTEWPVENGKLAMVSEPLNLNSLLETLGECPNLAINPRTRIGHIHLNVSNLEQTRHFYSHQVGFEVTQDSFAGAIFFASNGYHHHIGANNWNGPNIMPAPHGAAGLVHFEIKMPDLDDLAQIRQRLDSDAIETYQEARGFSAMDPSGIRVLFSAANI